MMVEELSRFRTSVWRWGQTDPLQNVAAELRLLHIEALMPAVAVEDLEHQ